MIAWKAFELRVCRALGGGRRGPMGRNCSDCTDEVPVAVECKLSKRGTPTGAWIAKARKTGRKEGKPWWLVVGLFHSPRITVTMDFLTAVELLTWAKRGGWPGSDRMERLRGSVDSTGTVDADEHIGAVVTELERVGS